MTYPGYMPRYSLTVALTALSRKAIIVKIKQWMMQIITWCGLQSPSEHDADRYLYWLCQLKVPRPA